ncbi:MAG TPA: hypothetical protein VMK42_05065 [Anaeromyxobacteraceae bacterium]|nr:hypothetical protein [Anaeromyxobacteraceae bacterium]
MTPLATRQGARSWQVAALSVLLLAGCASIGPSSIVRDRFDYATAISESWKTQMLTNMVRIRYSEAPVFMSIESAIASYNLDLSGNASGQIGVGSGSTSSVTLGATAGYGDHPTITYNPLVGDRFNKALLTPLPPGVLLTLIQAGWNAEVLFRCCVQAVNGLQNHSSRSYLRRAADTKFVRLMDLFGQIQRAGGMGVNVQQDEKSSAVTFFFSRTNPPPEVVAAVAEAKKLLGIAPDAKEYTATYGITPKDDKEVAILTRSMLEILLDLSSYVEVPLEHVVQHRAAPGIETAEVQKELLPLLRVHNGASKPNDAFAATPYRGRWFWIDDTDLQSKGVFSFLMFLFTVSETGTRAVSPVLTIPAG